MNDDDTTVNVKRECDTVPRAVIIIGLEPSVQKVCNKLARQMLPIIMGFVLVRQHHFVFYFILFRHNTTIQFPAANKCAGGGQRKQTEI